jgi:hypothetical protein
MHQQGKEGKLAGAFWDNSNERRRKKELPDGIQLYLY